MPGVSKKIYEINESLFDEFDETSLYVLGFFYACSTICRRGDNISLTISCNYAEHLQKLNLAMGSTYPIRKTATSHIINIANGNFIKKVEELGIHANGKFEYLEYPEFLKKNNNAASERHFLRGYFDGKGSFAVSIKNKKITSTISCRNLSFLEEIRDRVVLYGISRVNITNSNGKTTNYIRYNKTDTRRLYNFLYLNSAIYNKRTRSKYFEAAKELYD